MRRSAVWLVLVVGCSRELGIPPIPASDPLVVAPEQAQVAPLGTAAFTAQGGTRPYGAVRRRLTPGDDEASVTIEGAVVTYHAGALGGSVDEIEVLDATHETVVVRVAVGAPLQIVPPSTYVAAGGETTFVAVGGQPPYRFALAGEPCTEDCSSIEETTGRYVASPRPIEDAVEVRDANGAVAHATVTTGAELRILNPSIDIAPGEQVELAGFGGRGSEHYAWNLTGPDGGAPPAGLVLEVPASAREPTVLKALPDVAVAAGARVDARVELRDGSPALATVDVDVADPVQAPVVTEEVEPGHILELPASRGTYSFAPGGNLSGGVVTPGGRYVAGPSPLQIDRLRVSDVGGHADFIVKVSRARLGPVDYAGFFGFPSRPYGRGLPIVDGHLLAGRAHLLVGADGTLVPLHSSNDTPEDLVDVYGDGSPEGLLGAAYFSMSAGGDIVQVGQIELGLGNETILLGLQSMGVGLVSNYCRTPSFMTLRDAMLPGAYLPCSDPELVHVARLDAGPLLYGRGRFATVGSTGANLWQLDYFTGVPKKLASCATPGDAAIGADVDGDGDLDAVYVSTATPAKPELVACLATGRLVRFTFQLPFAGDPPVLHAPALGGDSTPRSVLLDGDDGVFRWSVVGTTFRRELVSDTLSQGRAVLGAGDVDGDGALDLVTLDLTTPDRVGDIELLQAEYPGVLEHQARVFAGVKEDVGVAGVLDLDADLHDDVIVSGSGNLRVFSGVSALPWNWLHPDDPPAGTRPGLAVLQDAGPLPLLALMGRMPGMNDGRLLFFTFTGNVALVRPSPLAVEKTIIDATCPLAFENFRASAVVEVSPGNVMLLVAKLRRVPPGTDLVDGVCAIPLAGSLDHFTPAPSFTPGGNVEAREGSSPRFALTDVTGDGIVDALLLPEATGQIEVHAGSGSGRDLQLAKTGQILGSRKDARAILLGAKGKVHVLFVSGPSRAAGALESGSLRTMPLFWDAGLTVNYDSARLDDVDGDGIEDLVFEAYRAVGNQRYALFARLGTGTDGVDAVAVPLPPGISDFTFADLDGDGDDDMLLWSERSPVLHVWDNRGKLTFAPSGAP